MLQFNSGKIYSGRIMIKILRKSLGVLLFVMLLSIFSGCNGKSSSSTSQPQGPQEIQSFVLNLAGNPTYISTESGQISGTKITLTTPVGTNAINTLSATITTSDGVVHNNVSLTTSNPITDESKATTAYIVTASSGLTNGYIVIITIPSTLFSCIADNNESPAPKSPCACLIQNDGSGLVWDVESMLPLGDLIPDVMAYNPVESTQNYLNTVFNPQSHCGYNDWRVPTSESTGVYASVSTFAELEADVYYLWNINSSDQTDMGRLGYFSAHNSGLPFESIIAESIGFTGWLASSSVTPPLYIEIAESLGMTPDYLFLVSEPYDYCILLQQLSGTCLSPVMEYNVFIGTYIDTKYSGTLIDGDTPTGLLPVRGGQ